LEEIIVINKKDNKDSISQIEIIEEKISDNMLVINGYEEELKKADEKIKEL